MSRCAVSLVKMTAEMRLHTRLREILSTIDTLENTEYFEVMVDPNGTTTGLISQIFMGWCQNKENGEITHVAIKDVPVTGFTSSYEKMYTKEIYFYSTIFPALDRFQKEKRVKVPFVNVPRYLCGHPSEKREFLIMENLTPAGYKLFERTKSLNSQHLKVIFEIFGKFHALSFVYKHEHPDMFDNLTQELVDIANAMIDTHLANFMESAYSAAIDSFDVKLESDMVERLRNIRNIKQSLKELRHYRGNYSCLAHGDCKISNMLFKHKESGELEDVKFIDFQLVYVGTPIHDLSYFFYSGAAKVDMDKLDYYLEVYYSSFSSFVTELGANPQEIYPFAILKKEWKEYSLIGMLLGIGMWGARLINKDELIALITKNDLPKEQSIELFKTKMREVHRGNIFRERAKAICMHAVEYGIL